MSLDLNIPELPLVLWGGLRSLVFSTPAPVHINMSIVALVQLTLNAVRFMRCSGCTLTFLPMSHPVPYEVNNDTYK